MTATPTTTLRAAIAARLDDRAIEAETFAHDRNYHKLHVYRDGSVIWHEFINRSDDLIDDRAEGFRAIPSLITVGTGSCVCNCAFCEEVYYPEDEKWARENGRPYNREEKYDNVEDAVADAVGGADLTGRVDDILSELERIEIGYFDDEDEDAK